MLLAVALGCGSKKTPDANTPEKQPGIVTQPYILLKNEYSLLKNPGKEVPAYQIPNLDSFVVDIKGYDFVLPSPAFDYIGEGIDYPKMLGGSWAYLHIMYNDSLVLKHPDMKEIVPDEQFAITGLKEQLGKNPPKEFKLAFRFYIDNGKGMQEIDQFRVMVTP